MLRLDLLDPLLSGNKWFKLRPHIEAAAAAGADGLISLGGAHSNHLHALAAAGALEAAIAWHVLHDNPQGKLPVHWWDGVPDGAMPALPVVQPGFTLGRQPQAVLSNSFAFGGSNCSLLLTV